MFNDPKKSGLVSEWRPHQDRDKNVKVFKEYLAQVKLLLPKNECDIVVNDTVLFGESSDEKGDRYPVYKVSEYKTVMILYTEGDARRYFVIEFNLAHDWDGHSYEAGFLPKLKFALNHCQKLKLLCKVGSEDLSVQKQKSLSDQW